MKSLDQKIQERNKQVAANGGIRKRKVGRPSVKDREANEAAMAALTNGFLMNSQSDLVGNKILQVALDDEHPRQGVAMKICADRLLPLDQFVKAAGQSGRSAVQINITGIALPEASNSSMIDGDSGEILQN